MDGTASRLQSRKEDLFAALLTLERDYADGLIPEETYLAARSRYEHEAAGILEQLDRAPGARPESRRSPGPGRLSRPAVLMSIGCVLAAIALLLLAATHRRLPFESVTGSAGAPAAPTSAATPRRLRAAEAAFQAHPDRYGVVVQLGNAYLATGNLSAAAAAYSRAEKLMPDNPDAPTLRAMILGAERKGSAALSMLTAVERAHPGYARAWLLDGLLAVHNPQGYRRAVSAWRHFLMLRPTAPISPQVRRWLKAAQQAAHA